MPRAALFRVIRRPGLSEAPPGYRWRLPLLYLVFSVAIVILYVPCRWFAELKARRSDKWLSYL